MGALEGDGLPELRVFGERLKEADADFATDCRHFRGDRPCVHGRLCPGCEHHAPYRHRVCVIKLGALGDVIRTLSILPQMRRLYDDAHVTWVSRPDGCRMIRDHPLIDRTLSFDAISAMLLQQERFDLVICLDKEPQPCALASAIKAPLKLGLGLSPEGKPIPLNREARAYFRLGLSNELKFIDNRKSYPRLIHEALGWGYDGQRYELPVDPQRRHEQRRILGAKGWRDDLPTLGINVGAAKTFANKMWPPGRIVQLIHHIRQRQVRLQILLLGGRGEGPIVDRILRHTSADVAVGGGIDAGTDHDEPSFVALVDACDVVFSGDTMAMHVAVALGKGVVVFFGPTCPQEIDLFGRGEKLVARTPCAPCYKRVCDSADICLQAVPVADAVAAIERVLKRNACREFTTDVRRIGQAA
jgi:ADP-heptose:LPS heptosyltransferase